MTPDEEATFYVEELQKKSPGTRPGHEPLTDFFSRPDLNRSLGSLPAPTWPLGTGIHLITGVNTNAITY